MKNQDLELKKYDTLLHSKFYTRDHLLKFIEQDYTYFLDVYLKEFLEANKKILMLEMVDKKTNKVMEYFLNFKKYHLSESTHKGTSRKKSVLSTEEAERLGITRQIILSTEVYLSVKEKGAAEQTEQPLTRIKGNYQFGRIPLLINSKYDLGSKPDLLDPYFFIVNGTPRTLYNLLEPNPLVNVVKKGLKEEYYCKVSTDPFYNSHPLVVHLSKEKGAYVVSKALSSKNVSLGKLLKALKTPLNDILDLVSSNVSKLDLLNLIYQQYKKDPIKIYTQLYQQLINTQIPEEINCETQVLNYLKTNLLWNSTEENWINIKQKQLTDLFYNLTKVSYGSEPEPFLDDLSNKRLFTLKDHFIKVFATSFKQVIEKAKVILLKDLGLIKKTKSLTHVIRSQLLKKAFKKYMCQLNAALVEPHSEHLGYTNKLTLLSDQRKIVSNLNKTLMHPKYRSINPSESGRICPVHTPASRSVGLVKHLALGTKASIQIPFEISEKLTCDLSGLKNETEVYYNDKFVGYHTQPAEVLYAKWFKLKRKYPIGLVRKENKIFIQTSTGRLLRPVYLVSKNELLISKLSKEEVENSTLDDLVSKGVIAYIDYFQQKNSLIVDKLSQINKDTQYVYLSPELNLSFLGSSLLLVSNNAAHRASLSLRLVNQAIGSKLDKSKFKYDQLKLQYLQKAQMSLMSSMSESMTNEYLGQNMVMAFSPGQNEEDSLELNLSAIQRGLMNSMMWKKTTKDVTLNDKNQFNYKPIPGQQNDEPTILEEDGLPKLGALVDQDIVALLDQEKNSKSTKLRSPFSKFYVTEIQIDKTSDYLGALSFKFSKLRSLGVGDKLGARNGLKGVVSKLTSELDLWIPQNGINPSLYISNHVINSRMILGPLIEVYVTKSKAISGNNLSTPLFIDPEELENLIQQCKNILESNGYDKQGYEYGCSSSGELLKLNVGPTKILLLEHHARDKIFLRTQKGGLSFITRQPSAGRSAGGGLRFGEMEVNSGIEAGATEFIKERLSVDYVKVKICKCGYLWDKQKEGSICNVCGEPAQLTTVSLPYAFIMLIKILKAGHIGVKFSLTEKLEDQVDKLMDQIDLEGLDAEDLDNDK